MKGRSKRKLITISDLPQPVQDETDDQVNFEDLNDDENEHDEHDQNDDENEGEVADEIVVPHLADGYYVIEAVRKKRVRKGVTQYLIKWHGWPESSNTWEPVENLSACLDLIKAFEESLRPTGNGSNRKCKRNTGSAKLSNNTGSFTDSSQIGQEKENKTEFAIHIQDDIEAENGISNVDDGERVLRSSPRIGSKRKSSAVKRLKKDTTGKIIAASDVIVVNESKNDLESENVVDTTESLPVITKIVNPVNYSTSIINDSEEVCVSFLVIRSDGEEVVVNNEYLKENNPVLLINFYEKHLRYKNPSE
ncbi:probable chromo domain-containing protein LHP1 [Rutidosis leptorrhynchoides]|uniref:probable chromo domain-containing protein LHP1 n=1 Tax=Rutidosis leptorrhynchoides TaxID=125765 RepID=UPI003A98DE55